MAEERAQETAGAPPAPPGDAGVLSPGYIHYGDLTYLPGQLLPAEVAAALRAQRPDPDEHNVYRVSPPAGRRKPRRETT